MSPGSKFTTLIDPTTAVPDAVQIRCLESLGDREIQGLSDERLYAREGWQRCGEIPNFALWPDGSPCATVIFFKMLGTQPAAGRDRMQASRGG